MNKVSKNWENLVRLILQREQLRDADQVDGEVVPNFSRIRSSFIFAGRAKLEERYEFHTTSETSSDEVGNEDIGIDDANDDDCVILETDPFEVEMIRTTNNHSTNSAVRHYFQKNGSISHDSDEDECMVLKNKPLEKELTDDVTLSLNTEDCHKLRISKTKTHECIFIDNDDDDFGSIHGNCVVVEVKASDKEIMNRIITLSRKLSLRSGMDDARKSGNEDDLSIIAERGQVACRDYPHSRHLCAQHPFNRTPHETYCYKCYCYVCEVKAPCKYWEKTVEGHCHASEVDSKWKEMREGNRSSCNDRFCFTHQMASLINCCKLCEMVISCDKGRSIFQR